MTQRNKLEFAINTPTEITLLFDEPIVGHSQYGTYNLYAVESNGVEYSLFAPEIVHEQIKDLKKGQSAIVTRLAAQRGSKIVSTYDVIRSSKPIPKPTIEVKEDENYDFSIPLQDKRKDPTYNIMLESLRDAVAISSELGGMIDANKIGISLFIARSKSNYGG